ncbi:acyl-CoA dehydrogenase [Pseudomonas lactis]|uniref:3-methylmercaptopropionyl-CoA dehydrogenase n=1 Tax=Pseudomonas lactis TaxID=1615674 RepID=A0A7Y1M791_9PSED|nr:acyl-CoA dehydrogenase C-terminal domain-containing protein [Pseudomonas lactis]NNA76490.1 acyl-CoA dehydrogenase [Pseudomonas lactis]
MTPYKAPLDNVQFLMNDVFAFPELYVDNGDHEADPEIVRAILEGAAKFSEQVIAPLNASGDLEGCKFDNGVVTTPKGFKESYKQFIDDGWSGLSAPLDLGGQGLPESLSLIVSEMLATANPAWTMYTGLSHGAIATLEVHGSAQQKETYLQKLVEGEWTGTMCLTEPHCGTDLGLIKSKAEPQADGSYTITGTKIFISAGEHDMSENIVHLVLARAQGAAAGTKGLSLFIVPKLLPLSDGTPGPRNAVSCSAVEKKMGIKAAATCVMHFDGAKGFLVGQESKGLNNMFTFMNTARIITAMQGLCSGERSFQAALAYAKDRLQMRALSGAQAPELPADPIIVHPDVRKMLLTIKSITEGNRALLYFSLQQLDIAKRNPEPEQRQRAEKLLSFITPICKAFMTESGFEVTNTALQVFGGHGYIQDTGVEQLVRDCRIATIYEGTTGVQALDLLGRKILADRGETLSAFAATIHAQCLALGEHPQLGKHAQQLTRLVKLWQATALEIGSKSLQDPDEIGAASVDFLMYSGYVILGHFWLKMAATAQVKLQDEQNGNANFYSAKLKTCDFYFKRVLPRTEALLLSITSGADSMMAISVEEMSL